MPVQLLFALNADELRYLTFLANALPTNELGRKLGLSDPDVPSTVAERLLQSYQDSMTPEHSVFMHTFPPLPAGYLGLVVDNTDTMSEQ